MITQDDTRRVASLAMIAVAEGDLPQMTAALAEMVAFAKTVGDFEDDGIGFDGVLDIQNAYREDVVIPSMPREEFLRCVDGGEDGFYLVKRRQ